MAADLNPYQVLGVSQTATQDEIKTSYRNLAKKYHPDLNPGKKEAEKKFKEISHAYELIGSSESRTKYDRGEFDSAQMGAGAGPQSAGRRYYYNTQQETPGFQGGRYTFHSDEGIDEELFQSIFGNLGGSAGRTPPRKGQDQTYRLDVELKDSVLGAEKDLVLPSGKKIRVTIPSGVKSGTRLRFSGLGDPAPPGGTPGDAYIEVQVRQDPRFKVDGDNLITDLPISLDTAVFGGEVRAPTLDGEVLLKIPPRSNTGTLLRLSGKGLTNRSTQQRGDELVSLRLMLPEKIDPELEDALRKWKERQHQEAQRKGAA